MTYAVVTGRADVALVWSVDRGPETFTIRAVAASELTIIVSANDDTSKAQRAAVQEFVATVALAAPPVPAGLRVSAPRVGAASVSWTTLLAWREVTTYQVEVQSPEGVQLPFESPLTDIDAPPVEVDGLLLGAYRFRVRAVNEVADGDWLSSTNAQLDNDLDFRRSEPRKLSKPVLSAASAEPSCNRATRVHKSPTASRTRAAAGTLILDLITLVMGSKRARPEFLEF